MKPTIKNRTRQSRTELLEEFKNSGALQATNENLSACYVTISIAIQYLENAEFFLKKYELYMPNLRHHITGIEKQFDMLHIEFKKLIGSQECQNRFNNDMEQIRDELDKLFNF